jgi:hypothetical protein
MIRELAVAAAAAAVGYAIGQRGAESPESRFSRPEVTGDEVSVGIGPDDVVVGDGHIDMPIEKRRRLREEAANNWPDEFDTDGRIGQ